MLLQITHIGVLKMATEKLFSVVGIACKKGEYKVRWANDLVSRTKMLTRDGQTDIRLVALSEPVTKLEAVQAIIDHELFADDIAQLAIDEFLYSVNGKTNNKKATTVVDTVDEPVVTYDDLVDDDIDSALLEAFAASDLAEDELVDELGEELA